MALEDILTKEAIDDIYKDIYTSREYRKLADKYQSLKAQGNIAQAVIYAKKMKQYEIGVFEGIARRYVDRQMMMQDWVSSMTPEDRIKMNVLSYGLFMMTDVFEMFIMDVNTIVKKYSGGKTHAFDKLNESLKESKKVISSFDGWLTDNKESKIFGSVSDNLYEMLYNKANSLVNKIRSYEEQVKRKAKNDEQVAKGC